MADVIVVPFDFSPAAQRALRWAAAYQKATGAEPLRVIHVLTPSYLTASAGVPVSLPTEEDLEAVRKALTDAVVGCGATTQVRALVAPSIGMAIRDVVEAEHAALVVMGTHGRGGISRAVLGSVADDLIRHVSCPVVTMREA